MTYLLDANVLVAWGWADHAHHARVVTWLERTRRAGDAAFMTSAIPQLGFVRVSVQHTLGRVTPEEAGRVLAAMLSSLGQAHRFVPDDQAATEWPRWCRAGSRTTAAHLLALAAAHGAQLAILDTGIPGAFVVPPA